MSLLTIQEQSDIELFLLKKYYIINAGMGYKVLRVQENSIADEVGISPGDEVVDFNNQEFVDIIDYEFFASKKRFSIGYIDKKGDPVKAIIRKEADEPLGLIFEKDLLGTSRACGNRCIFCFVDQLPKGMRKSLYHKDEDWRYSFIYGNYVTLATLSDKELRRIKKRDISFLYISVHVIDEEMRKLMLGNEKAKQIKPLLKKLAKYGITMHTQVVLLSGINDGKRLEETYRFLKGLYPKVKSLSVIPVGLTGHRDGLYPLKDISKDEATRIIESIEIWQNECRRKFGTGFVYASDEMYLKARKEIPKAEMYDGFPQIENGVGLIAKFEEEFFKALNQKDERTSRFEKCSVLTGSAFYPYIKGFVKEIVKKFEIDIECFEAKNSFFGGAVDVAGLLTSEDIEKALRGKDIGEALFISESLLRDGEGVFLDDKSIKDLSKALHCEIIETPVLGDKFLEAFLMN